MKKRSRLFFLRILPLGVVFLLSSFQKVEGPALKFPYRQAGLTEREAAAHLLNRFSFGSTPGQVDAVVKKGVEEWFAEQLAMNFKDDSLEKFLSQYESLAMSNAEIAEAFPRPAQVLNRAIRDGVIDKDSAKANDKDKKDYRKDIKKYMDEKGYKPLAELYRQLINQKILRAVYSGNQLREVMTDFWFNHFNVSINKGGVGQFVMSYERDVIRPNVLGNFETMLLATAKSPAMLTYLDNSKSTVNEENTTDAQKKMAARREAMTDAAQNNPNAKIRKPKMEGLNENYAREIMELHTLGVDGGYTQTDVTQAARILTGWTLNPEVEYNVKAKRKPNRKMINQMGFVLEDDFLFAANKHDKGEKKVLGTTFPAGAGYDEGVKLIHMLATHPSTAKFISRKLAVRFVSDDPPQSLVNKMAKTFLEKEGNIKEVLITMVSSPEFWSKNALREKTKSPFELAISSVRSINAKVEAPYQLYTWMNKMGQKIYSYQAPTGFPDKGQYWINTGALLNRMNFGLALASGRIPGIRIDLLALNKNHEPESAEDALKKYSMILMPERNLEETIKRLTPMLTDPELVKKIDDAASKTPAAKDAIDENDDDEMMDENQPKKKNENKGKKNLNPKNDKSASIQYAAGNNSMLAQVVGIIIGSPEFQRK